MKLISLSGAFLLGFSLFLAPAQEVTVGAFTGADIGEGLDLNTTDGGDFLFAVNIGGGEVQVGEVTFTADTDTPGLTWEAVNHIPDWESINEFGNAADDVALAEVMHSIRWTPAPGSVKVSLADVTPGVLHRLQLLFAEKCCQRGWDITVDGELVADEFSARELTEDANIAQGAFFRYDFLPESEVIEIDLNGENAAFADQNPILSAVTLERLKDSVDDPNLVVRSRLQLGRVASTPSSTESLTLRNLGASKSLAISDVRVAGADAANFSVSSPPETLPPGETFAVEVTFDSAGRSGLFQGTLEFLSDDPGDPVLGVDVTASVINAIGPAANFTFDDPPGASQARDVSGNDRHGSYLNDFDQVDLGQEPLASGTAARFAGGAHVTVPGSAFDEALGSFGVSMWIKPDALPPGWQTLFGKGNAESPTFALLTFGETLAWFTGGEDPEFTTGNVLKVGQAHHIGVIYDDTLGARKVSLFLDGVAVAQVEEPVAVSDSRDFNLVIGAYNGALPLVGLIDDFQLYDRPITADDIAFLRDNPGKTLGEGGEVDSDGDGLSDAAEAVEGTDPLDRDTDGDDLSDGAELNVHDTDPHLADTDGDGFGDGTELRKGSDPKLAGSTPDNALEIGTFTGGDPGEGLDMGGAFLYAVNFSGPGGSRVGDAQFTDAAVEGVTIQASNSIPNWHAANYGDSPNDNGLELVLGSIRWDTAPVVIELENLRIGQRYALQLLFAESCCQRGFDIVIDGELEADEFSPDLIHSRSTSVGVVAHYIFTAEKETLNITLANDEADFPDRNPIINGLTLKLLGVAEDSDNDGLLDSWETLHFGNLTPTAAGDPDNDTLTNLQELELGTHPNSADTDGDGLADGVEAADARTHPLLADSDADGASDGAEVNELQTDPANPDTDGDGDDDGFEAAFSGDPLDANVKAQPQATATAFTGGDAGEGLDLDGDFVYAINMLGAGDLQVRDANFTNDDVEGLSFFAPNATLEWHAPDYGDSANDDDLEIVMQSIRWNGGPVDLKLGGLTSGNAYKLQLLFAENCCDRGWDIDVQGGEVFDDFNVQRVQGGIAETTMGVVVTVPLVALGGEIEVHFRNEAPAFPDNNPILNGLTLENLGQGFPPAGGGDDDFDGVPNAEEATAGTDPDNAADYFRITEMVKIGDRLRLIWTSVQGKTYRIEFSETLEPASWTEVANGIAGDAGTATSEIPISGGVAGTAGYYRAVVGP